MLAQVLMWLIPGCARGGRGALHITTSKTEGSLICVNVNLTQQQPFNEVHVRQAFQFPLIASTLGRATFSSSGELIFGCYREDSSVKLYQSDQLAGQVWLGHHVQLEMGVASVSGVKAEPSGAMDQGLELALKMIAVAFPLVHVQVDDASCKSWRTEGRYIARGSATASSLRVELVQDLEDESGVKSGQVWHKNCSPVALSEDIARQLREGFASSKNPTLQTRSAALHIAVVNDGPIKGLDCREAARKAANQLAYSAKRCAVIARSHARYEELLSVCPMLGTAFARVVYSSAAMLTEDTEPQEELAVNLSAAIAGLWRGLYLPAEEE